MNRILNTGEPKFPDVKGAFTDKEAFQLRASCKKDPSNISCPKCGPDQIEVLAFIEPAIDDQGFATLTEPEDEYAMVLYCHTCERAIGIIVT